MEFRYRAIDSNSSRFTLSPPHPPPSVPSTSSFGYFAQQAQAFRVGYSRTNYASTSELFQSPGDFREAIRREAIERELEKHRIREEIILAEIVRKRALEAEVRREMMLEREWALTRGDVLPIPFSSSSAGFRYEPRFPFMHHSEGSSRLVDERISLLLCQRETGGFDSTPLRSNFGIVPKISEYKSLPERAMILAKPEANSSRVKRKAVTPPALGASELPPFGSNKKVKEEWSCALCQVSATSEQGFKEHLSGKKHKLKVQGLRAQNTGKHFGIGLSPKKTSRRVKPVEISDSQVPKLGEKIVEESLLDNMNVEQMEKINEPLVQLNKNAIDFKKKLKEPEQKMKKIRLDKKKKFKFWCELCKVGTFSEKVMNEHENGKKHVARLKEANQNHGAVTATQVAVGKTATADEVSKDRELQEMENAVVVDAAKSSDKAASDEGTAYPCLS